MNYLATLILLSCITRVVSQSYMEYPNNTLFHDVPGNTYLATYIENSKTIVSEIDDSGNILWRDSIAFNGGQTNYTVNKIVKFKGMDLYAILMEKPYYVSTIAADSDTSIIQLSAFSLGSQQFLNSTVDTTVSSLATAVGGGFQLISHKDSSLLLFNTFVPTTMAIELSKISPTLSIDHINTVNPPPSSLYFNTFYSNPIDSILSGPSTFNDFQSDEFHLFIDMYDDSLINRTEYSHVFSTGFDDSYSMLSHVHSKDSILCVMRNYQPLPPISNQNPNYERWKFTWLDYRLNVLNEHNIEAPADGMLHYYQEISALVNNNKIYVYAGANSSNYRIFVYDFNFNLECQIPIYLHDYSLSYLSRINEHVYLSCRKNDSTEYYKVDGCNSISSADNMTDTASVEIYPNPANSIITLSSDISSIEQINVYAINGERIRSINTNTQKLQLDVSDFTKGIYVISVHTSNGGITTKKLVIH